MEEEMQANDIDPRKPNVGWNELVTIVSRRWAKGGKDQEIRDTFRTFDKRDKGQVTQSDMKAVLQQYLDIQITDQEIQEAFEELDQNENGFLTFEDFYEFLKNEM